MRSVITWCHGDIAQGLEQLFYGQTMKNDNEQLHLYVELDTSISQKLLS